MDFRKWAQAVAWGAECGEGLSVNLPGDLECALRKAHRLGFAEGLVVGAGLVAGVIAITLLLRQMI